MAEQRDFLAGVGLLRELDRKELDLFEQALVPSPFEPGQLILEEGQPNRALHIVREGRVRVSRKVEDRDVILCDLPAGRTFGELSILEEGAASATLRAIPKTLILSLSLEDLNRIVSASPATAAKLWRAIAIDLRARLLQTNEVVRTYFEVNRALIENPTFREAYAMMAT
ncbi:MAG TPA: cyclic nucleotide-binding domain-containing protein [Thermoanaerobaculia bacterium]|nr:cyclic nucleotide-binding domain-containing protein [Thermoanaerobaculia bacterium]